MITLLAAYFFSYYFVNVAMIPNAIKKGFGLSKGTRIKPFDCVTCLSVWSAVALYFFPEIANFFFVIFGAGFLGNKLK